MDEIRERESILVLLYGRCKKYCTVKRMYNLQRKEKLGRRRRDWKDERRTKG
jgi:hypothetical protein